MQRKLVHQLKGVLPMWPAHLGSSQHHGKGKRPCQSSSSSSNRSRSSSSSHHQRRPSLDRQRRQLATKKSQCQVRGPAMMAAHRQTTTQHTLQHRTHPQNRPACLS